MMQFLANVLEQMDLALDQLAVNDINYKRFTLMLVDNVVELTLHQHASKIAAQNKMWGQVRRKSKHPPKLIEAALGQNFDDKVKLAAHTELITNTVKDTILILHSFRNQVYHRGMTHEAILPGISLFYFQNACDLLQRFRPDYYSWGSKDSIPYRARKYLGSKPLMNLDKIFPEACGRLREVSEGFSIDLPQSLASHIEVTIDEIDHNIQFLADDSPHKMTRDAVIIHSQMWPFAFSKQGKAFAKANSCKAKTMAEYVKWMKENYNWNPRKDPISGWKRRLATMRKEADPHKALSLYKNFMDQTERLRSQITEAAIQLDHYIQFQIDLARGK
jgi:hypothetical protein